MAESIGQIPIEIFGDWSKLQQDLLKVEALAQQAATKIADSFNNASTKDAVGPLDDIREALGRIRAEADEQALLQLSSQAETLMIAGAAVAGAIGAAATAVTHLVLEEGKAAEETSNLANRLNLTFEETKQLSEMAQIAGVGIESLGRVSMRLADALQDPAGAGKKVAVALHEMGISAADSGDALRKLLEKLAEIPDATERISKAHEVMGRGAIQLEPLLRNYTELKAAVESLGGQLSSDMVAKLKEADDAADKLGIAWSHLKEHLAATFAPAVTAGLDTLRHILGGDMATDSIDRQIAQLTMEIYDLGEQAKQTSFSLSSMFAASTGMGGIGAEGSAMANAVKEQKEAQLRMLEGQKEAFERSKEYNEILNNLASESQQKQATAAGNQKKLDAAWHKQNLEDIKKENKAREDNVKLSEKFNKVSAALAKAGTKTQDVFDKAWTKYDLETRKAIGITDEAKHKFGELSEIHVELKDRLSAPMMAAYAAGLKLRGAYQLLGLDAQHSGTAMIAAFDTFAAAGTKDLFDIENAWSRVSGQVDKLARTNLPLAIREYEKYIALLSANGAAIGQIFQAQERLLDLEIKEKALRGESATEQIIQLEQIRNSMDALNLQTRGLGQVYVDIMSTFHNAFTELSRGLANSIIEWKGFEGVVVNVFKNIAKHILETLIGYAFKQLDAQLTKTGGILDTVAQKITGALSSGGTLKIPGFGGGGGSSPVNLPEGIGNTPGAGGIPGMSGGGSAGGAGAAGGLAGALPMVNAITGAVTAITSVLQFLQGRRMEQDIGRIEVTTRGILNEALNFRRDSWEQQDNLFHKLDDMWNEIRNVVDILRLIGQSGLGTSTEGGAKSLSELIADVINSRPHSADSSANGPQPLVDAFSTLTSSATDVSYGLQSITPQIANLSNAVSDTSYAVQEVNRGLPPMVKATEQISAAMDAVTAAHFEMIKKQGGLMGAHSDWINVAPPDPQAAGIMAAWRRIGESFQKSPEGGGTGTFQPYGGATVTVNAVDPSGRQIALATIKGLEEQGIRTR